MICLRLVADPCPPLQEQSANDHPGDADIPTPKYI